VEGDFFKVRGHGFILALFVKGISDITKEDIASAGKS
jgi:hypothetical protein